ncbi:MAG TPA: GNAT family N-acetyltransferase [Cyclobacteriaceae bacterium]|nr:GNAT family N-acetyltransferase [Cyclobacteriaceae bacterium]
MNAIELKWESGQKGAFVIEEGTERLAEMAIGISDKNLTVYHTNVADKLKGQGVAQKLLDTMVDYARKHNLKVIALCPYVHAQFKRHPDKYEDIWNKNWHPTGNAH